MANPERQEPGDVVTPHSPNQKQLWLVLASFFVPRDNRWLDDFIQEDDIAFSKLAPPRPVRSWHAGSKKLTPLLTWLTHFRHARTAISVEPHGIITCFPQLALTAAVWKFLSHKPVRLIAYNFNIGALRPGLPRKLASIFAAQVDRFVVHSPEEIPRYADYLGIETNRFSFIPLQRGIIPITRREDVTQPFLVAMGSAHRDYPTLIKAVDRTGLKTVIITREADILTLPQSPHISFLSNLSETECLEILARSRICVTPIANLVTASGQVTFINAMQLGVPVVATRCPGTDGYITHELDGLLVNPFDVDDLARALSLLWNDQALRQRLSDSAKKTACERFSDEVAADRLLQIIRSLN